MGGADGGSRGEILLGLDFFFGFPAALVNIGNSSLGLGIVLAVNAEWKKLLPEVTGRSLEDLFLPPDAQAVTSFLDLLSQGRFPKKEVRLKEAKDSSYFLRGTLAFSEGSLVGVCLLQEILVERERRETGTQLEEAWGQWRTAFGEAETSDIVRCEMITQVGHRLFRSDPVLVDRLKAGRLHIQITGKAPQAALVASNVPTITSFLNTIDRELTAKGTMIPSGTEVIIEMATQGQAARGHVTLLAWMKKDGEFRLVGPTALSSFREEKYSK